MDSGGIVTRAAHRLLYQVERGSTPLGAVFGNLGLLEVRCSGCSIMRDVQVGRLRHALEGIEQVQVAVLPSETEESQRNRHHRATLPDATLYDGTGNLVLSHI